MKKLITFQTIVVFLVVIYRMSSAHAGGWKKSYHAGSKVALVWLMEQIYTLIKQADDNETIQQNYTQASQMLSGNVMPLIDGCATGSTGDDLITDCAYQKGVYAAAQQLVADCVNK